MSLIPLLLGGLLGARRGSHRRRDRRREEERDERLKSGIRQENRSDEQARYQMDALKEMLRQRPEAPPEAWDAVAGVGSGRTNFNPALKDPRLRILQEGATQGLQALRPQFQPMQNAAGGGELFQGMNLGPTAQQAQRTEFDRRFDMDKARDAEVAEDAYRREEGLVSARGAQERLNIGARSTGALALAAAKTAAAGGDKFATAMLTEASRLRRETGLPLEEVMEEAKKNALAAFGKQDEAPMQPAAPMAPQQQGGIQPGGIQPVIPPEMMVRALTSMMPGGPHKAGPAGMMPEGFGERGAPLPPPGVPGRPPIDTLARAGIRQRDAAAGLAGARATDIPLAAQDRTARTGIAGQNAAATGLNAQTNAERQRSTATYQSGRLQNERERNEETRRHNSVKERLQAMGGRTDTVARTAAQGLLSSYQRELEELDGEDAFIKPGEVTNTQRRIKALRAKVVEMRQALEGHVQTGAAAPAAAKSAAPAGSNRKTVTYNGKSFNVSYEELAQRFDRKTANDIWHGRPVRR